MNEKKKNLKKQRESEKGTDPTPQVEATVNPPATLATRQAIKFLSILSVFEREARDLYIYLFYPGQRQKPAVRQQQLMRD